MAKPLSPRRDRSWRRIASHELRTPLASLRLSAQGLLRAAECNRAVSPEILDRTLRRVLDNTARLEQLTSELLDVTRIEQGRLQLNPIEIALDAIVRDAVAPLPRRDPRSIGHIPASRLAVNVNSRRTAYENSPRTLTRGRAASHSRP